MSRNILAETMARTIGGMLAPLFSWIPWPIRVGCGCLAVVIFFGVLLVLALIVGGGVGG